MPQPSETQDSLTARSNPGYRGIPLKLSVSYLGLAVLWVLVWDVFVGGGWREPMAPWRHIVNDGGAVLATSVLLYLLLHRYFARLSRAEADRQEHYLRYQVLAEAAREGILIHEGGVVVEVNAALERLVEYSREELVGSEVWRLVAPDFHPAVRHAMATHSTQPYEVMGVKKSGITFPVELCAKPFQFQGHERRLVTVMDLTERVKLEGQFRHAQKMEAVGRLAGGIAHDFNNLLTAILGYSGFVLDKMKPEDPMRQDVAEIQKAGERAAGLTRQLLAFSRKQESHPVEVDIHGALVDMEKLIRRLVGEDVRVVIQSDPSAGRVLVDHGQLEQVLMNLAVNARDAMPSGGTLTLSAGAWETSERPPCIGVPDSVGPFVRIAVSDTGVGMSEDVKAHLFEPFFTTKAEGKGTGLGLATVYGIVKRHRGCLAMESTVGQGSTFTVLLPKVEAEGLAAAEGRAADRPRRGSESVLFVEDDAEVRRVMVHSLREHGYDVVEAVNGQEGLDRFVERPMPFDVLVTDSVMPTMSGDTLTAKLKAFQPNMAVVHISGHADAGLTPIEAADDLVAFLRKPFRPEALLDAVRRLADRRRQRLTRA